jgi:hypothetical protein
LVLPWYRLAEFKGIAPRAGPKAPPDRGGLPPGDQRAPGIPDQECLGGSGRRRGVDPRGRSGGRRSRRGLSRRDDPGRRRDHRRPRHHRPKDHHRRWSAGQPRRRGGGFRGHRDPRRPDHDPRAARRFGDHCRPDRASRRVRADRRYKGSKTMPSASRTVWSRQRSGLRLAGRRSPAISTGSFRS